MARLRLDRVTKLFGSQAALDAVSLDVADGEFLAVLGPSGCGKTTLLRLVAGFDTPDAGRLAIGDRVVSGPDVFMPPEERRVGIVFQSYALWPHMTVAENVGYALKVARLPAAERARRVEAALALVGLAGFGARRPATLSGGQRQRVALARCLAMEPALVLLDEPLANLDVHLRAAMEEEFSAFHARTGRTMIYVTHDQAEAMALADRIAVMDAGRIVQVGAPSVLYREPASEMVARFIGEGMVLPADVVAAAEGGRATVAVCGGTFVMRCDGDETMRDRARVCLRSGDLVLATKQEGALPAHVTRIVYRGGRFRVEARLVAAPDILLRLDVPEPCPVTVGDAIAIGVAGGWVIPRGAGAA